MDRGLSSSPTHTLDRWQKEKDRPQVKTRSVHRCSVFTRIGTLHMGFSCTYLVSFTAQTPAEDGVRIKQRTLDTQDLSDLYTKGSQGVCFVLLDVGLSQLMPNTRQLDRFFPHVQKLQIQPYLLTKVIISKVVEEFAHVDAHCFTRTTSQSKRSKARTILFILYKTNSFQDHCIFAVNLTFWMHTGSYQAQSSVNR